MNREDKMILEEKKKLSKENMIQKLLDKKRMMILKKL